MNAWVQLVRRARLLILGLCLVLCLAAGLLIPHLAVESDFLNFLPPEDAELSFFKETGKLFGGNYVSMVALQADDIFTADNLRKLDSLTRAYAKIEGVTHVMSLANVMDIRKTTEGIEVVELLPDGEVPETPEAMAQLRAYVLGKEMYTSTFVSKNARTAAIIVRLAEGASSEGVAAAIYDVTGHSWDLDHAYFAGFPMVMDYLVRLIWQDMSVLTALIAIVILGILFVSFRAPRGVILPLLTVVVATVLAFGVMAAVGAPLTLISSILPVVLFSTGTAYTIHLLNAVNQERMADEDGWTTMGRAMSKVGVAILLSGLTTLIGFLSLMSSPMTLFVDFGIFAAVGVAFALAFSISVVPTLVAMLKPGPPQPVEARSAGLLGRSMVGVGRLVLGHPKKLLLIAVLCVSASSVGVLRLRTEMDVFDLMGADSRPRQAEELIKREFGGSTPLSIHAAGDMKEPLVLAELLRMQKHLRLIGRVSGLSSIADLIAELNAKMNGVRAIPSTRAGIASLWLLLEGNAVLGQLVDADARRAMIQGRLREVEVSLRNAIVDDVHAAIANVLRPELVELAFAKLPEPARAQLVRQAATEIAADVELDLRHRDFELSGIDDLARDLQAQFGGTLTWPGAERRLQLGEAYFASDDCDLDIEGDEQAQVLSEAVAAANRNSEAELGEALAEAVPGLAEEDAEGVRLAAAALARRFDEAAVAVVVDRQLQALHDRVRPQASTWSQGLDEELRAELGRVRATTWAVTPERYEELTGAAAATDQIATLELRQTGLPVVQTRLESQLRRSQIISLAFALMTVFALLVLQLRSLTGGLISVVPIVFTLVVNFGTMGLLGITVNPATMLIAALAIGIGIDYTIHIVTRLRDELHRHDEVAEALLETLRTSGRAVVINVASVACGFVVLVASQLNILRQFGLMIAFSMVLCAVGALTLIPALVLVIEPRFIRGRRQGPTEGQ